MNIASSCDLVASKDGNGLFLYGMIVTGSFVLVGVAVNLPQQRHQDIHRNIKISEIGGVDYLFWMKQCLLIPPQQYQLSKTQHLTPPLR